MTQPLPPAELTDRYRAELGAAGDLIAVVRGAAGQLDRALSGRLPSLPDIRAAVERIERALAAWDAQPDGATVEQHQTRAIVEAAKYEYGARYCMEGDCDHAAEADDNAPDGAPCPLIETRYATAAQILAVDLLLTSNDGEPLDDAEEIPVGEIRRALGEARTAEVKP